MPNRKHVLGSWGESLAADYLVKKGYTILCRNYRTPQGEIDLVVGFHDQVIFVEVKTRTSRKFGYPEDSITQLKQMHLQRTAENYFQENPSSVSWQFDVIAIERTSKDRFEIHHFENVLA